MGEIFAANRQEWHIGLSDGLLVQSLHMFPVVEHKPLSVSLHGLGPSRFPPRKLSQNLLVGNIAERASVALVALIDQ